MLQLFCKDQRGFTLIELMTVVAIIAVLAGIGIPIYRNFIFKAQEAQVLTATDPVRQALAAYNAENGQYPADTSNHDLYTFLNTFVDVSELTDSDKTNGMSITNTRVQFASGNTTDTVWKADIDGEDAKGYIAYKVGTGTYTLYLYTHNPSKETAGAPDDDPFDSVAPFKCYGPAGEITTGCAAITAPGTGG